MQHGKDFPQRDAINSNKLQYTANMVLNPDYIEWLFGRSYIHHKPYTFHHMSVLGMILLRKLYTHYNNADL